MKKALKISGLSFLILFLLLIAVPFVFQGKFNDIIKQMINENLNAKVEFSDLSLSFIRSFPQAHVRVNDILIKNFAPFEDDTLTTVKDISFTMSLKELFKKEGEPLIINSIRIDEALLTLKTDPLGNSNYDISKKNNSEPSSDRKITFDIQDYSINNSALTFKDETSNMTLHLTEFNHRGHGMFSSEVSELDTSTETHVSFSMDSTFYLKNTSLKLDALIDLDLSNDTYTFKENKGYINQLPITFQGFLRQLDQGQEMEISFENPESDFKNFLAVLPEAYSKNIEEVETSGDFKVKGLVKGTYSEETIPNFDVTITSNNAAFKYPNLPKQVRNININSSVKNTTGHTDDTFIDIKTLDFVIDSDVFKSSATLKNITKNMIVNARVNGVINLENLTKAYPIVLDTPVKGILKGDITTAFDMEAIESNSYDRIKNSGSIQINNFEFTSKSFNHPFLISEANMNLNTGTVTLNQFKAKTGDSDLSATGIIKNLTGFLLSDGTLQGDFKVNSNSFNVNDFMTVDASSKDQNSKKQAEALKIPEALDCTINATAATVIYDNLNLKDVKGILVIRDQKASLNNLTSTIFDGALAITGDVTTKAQNPSFNLSLMANDFDIGKSFTGMELLQNLAPIAKVLQGKLNTKINLKGDLDEALSPVLSSISGNAFAQLSGTRVKTDESKIINSLEGALNFVNFKKLNLNDLKTQFEFADGKVAVKPFHLNYEDIKIEVSGTHGFDKSLNYNAIFNVPARYLGSDINRLIGRIDTAEANNISIPVAANITGSFTNPTVKTDLSSGVKNLTQQLIEIEKQKLLNQGKDKVKSLIGNVIGGNQTKSDSLKKAQNSTVNTILKDIVGNKTIQDSTSSNTNNAVKNVLGGLLGKKKKGKDSVN